MLNRHIDQTYLPANAKTQPIAIYTSHVIAMYVPETNMSLKYNICRLLMWRVSIYALYGLTALNSMNRSTCRHIFHIIGI